MTREEELQQFVVRESTSLDSIPVEVRMGRDPGSDRMQRLNAALEELDGLLAGQTALDRRFAFALYALAYHVEQQVLSWAREGKKWREDFLDDELPRLLMHVEYLLDGDMFADEL